MYNTNVSCEYQNISELDGDTIYRKELLTALELKEYDNKKMNDKIIALYDEITKKKENKDSLERLFKIVRDNNFWPIELDDRMCITMLFSYDYFYVFNVFLKSYFTTGKIEEEIINKFIELFTKKENI